jgi:hypothetical protein
MRTEFKLWGDVSCQVIWETTSMKGQDRDHDFKLYSVKVSLLFLTISYCGTSLACCRRSLIPSRPSHAIFTR